MTDERGQQVAVVETDFGRIVFRFLDDEAPTHTESFRKLARDEFYNGTTFHRVIPGFMIQGGDPNSRNPDRSMHGEGGPGYTLAAEIGARHIRGAVAAAREDDSVNPEKRSCGSQFYICVDPAPYLDGDYTVFGHVVRGMEVADTIASVPCDWNDNPLDPVVMKSVAIHTLAPGQDM